MNIATTSIQPIWLFLLLPTKLQELPALKPEWYNFDRLRKR
ncbi:hypothetical protein [Microcoleus sp. CAWBG58]|nr:hypothetical protein [Microcoleus sp. CAWBG58]